MQKLSIIILSVLVLISTGCTKTISKAELKTMLNQNPDILADAIRANPLPIAEAVVVMQQAVQKETEKSAAADTLKQYEKFFENPLKPELTSAQVFRGPSNAKVTIVEYLDFQCGYCSVGSKTIQSVQSQYSDQVRVTLKHLPLDFHSKAGTAAKYFEAVRMQKPDSAWAFHDALMNNQNEIGEKGETFLKSEAKKLGVNMARLGKDVQSKEIEKKIASDSAEAKQFGFSGTPGFLVNGVPVVGALPPEQFVALIDTLLKRN